MGLRWKLASGVLAALVLFLATVSAGAATFNVDCNVADLIAAISTANGNGEDDVINLAAGCTYTLTAVDNDTDGPNGLPSIYTKITINGNGATITRSSASDFRIFHLGYNGHLILNDLTITNGRTPLGDDGGGIYSFGTVIITNSTISGNSTASGIYGVDGCPGDGGGIYNAGGTLSLSNSTISGNSTGDGSPDPQGCSGGTGGGIFNWSGTVTITNTTVSHNSTGKGGDGGTFGYGGSGGGIFNGVGTLTINNSTISGNSTGDGGGVTGVGGRDGGFGGGIYSFGTVIITNSTISGNSTGDGGAKHAGLGGYGGGIYNRRYNGGGTLTITNSTISGNSTGNGVGRLPSLGGKGGGIYRDSGTIRFKNTIIAGNSAALDGPDCCGTLVSQDYNLVGDNCGCTFTAQSHDQVGTGASPIDPKLGPLANNGGSTDTHALLSGSPAIDTGDCTNIAGNPVASDQRGVVRPQGAHCDIGAFESAPGYTLTVNKAGPGTGTVTSDPTGIDCGATCSASYGNGAAVKLTANPDPGLSFAGWTGDCDASGHVTMVANKTCTATFAGAPEMDLEGGSPPVSIVDGDTTPATADGTDFGAVPINGGAEEHTFTVKNTGTADLNLTGAPEAQILGADAADFTVTVQPSTPIASGGGTTTFAVRFVPSQLCLRTATISIANSDPDEDPYDFAIQGTGIDVGDIDGNGTIDLLDARLCLQIATGVIPGTAAQRAAADVDDDGDVDERDAEILSEYVLGILTTLP